ncbi:MAG: outer membrane protein assembly factor BamA [Myxococcales bacterium]|nr:outer membrane protein assembly factor BamA [Myxococcales bacterium]MCB9708344.1 outer membrane protein assembly factor BamA [Myxococcales bacterium]
MQLAIPAWLAIGSCLWWVGTAQAQDPGQPASNASPAADAYELSSEPKIELPTTICQGRRIRRIGVRGNYRVASQDILATLQSKRGMPCTDVMIAKDARALWDMGYFEDIIVQGKAVGNAILLVYVVKERPSIGAIIYKGNDALDDEELGEVVSLRAGEILSAPKIQEQITKIRDKYAEEGHYLARIDYKLERAPRNEVRVVFIIDEGNEVTVRRIRFVGNYHLSDEVLRGIMQTSETGFFSFLSSGDTFQKSLFDEDVNRLQAYYYDQGYLNSQIGEPRVELTADRDYIDITVPVEEGPRFKVGTIDIQELNESGSKIEPLGGKATLLNTITLERGDWFSSTTIQKDLLEITRMYRDKGYAKVLVRPDTSLQEGKRIVDIRVAIERGPPVRIERIDIRGNTRTADKVIRREMRILEGELYSQTEIEHSKARITQLGYFERVDVAESPGSRPNRMALTFEVQERSTGTFQVGAGFSSIESFILTAQVQQQNIFGTGQSLSLQLQLSGIRQLAQLRFVEPYFLDTEWTLAVDAYKTIRQFQDFNQDRTGGRIALGHPILHENLRLFGQYTLEYVDISSRTLGFFGNSSARGFNIFQRLPLANLFLDGITSSITMTLAWDSRNNRMFPSEGVYASVSTEVADGSIGSDNTYMRHQAFARFYYPLLDNVVLKLNTEIGLITSRKPTGVPIFERYYLGGIMDVRGYYLRTLGPRVGLPRSTDPNAVSSARGVVVGGNLQAFYNLELEFPLIKPVGIRGVVFTDGGNTWNLENALCQAPQTAILDPSTDPCNVDLWRLRTSWGFGVRWISQVLPPLRFEWGFPINRRSYERDFVFEFSFGNSF